MTDSKDGIFFKEKEFENEMNMLRHKVITEIEKGSKQYNEGKISLKDYETAKSILLDQARDARVDIIRRRKEAISEAGIRITQKMAMSDDVSKFREIYEKINNYSKEELTNFYQTSLKLNDTISARAGALIASEKGIPEILIDYGKRDSEFVEHFKEKEALKERYTSAEKKMIDQLGIYRSVTAPREETIQEEAGKFLDREAGQWRSYYKPKIKVKS